MNIAIIRSNAGATTHLEPIRTGAFALSLLVHGALFVGFGEIFTVSHSNIASTSITRLFFLQPLPVPEAVQEQPEAIPEQAEEVIKEAPKKVEQVKKLTGATPEKQPPPKVQQQARPLAAAAPDEIVHLEQGLIRLEKMRYMNEVLAHIEHHKWYPKIARRMGIEGTVKVRFNIHADGSAHDLLIEHGPEALIAAARKTVERSLPLPQPPEQVDCPLACEFRMRFKLSGIEHD